MKKLALSAFLFVSSAAFAQTPIDGWYSNVFGGFALLPKNIDIFNNSIYWDHARYHFGYDVGGAIGFKSNPLRYEGQFTYLDAKVKSVFVNGLHPGLLKGESTATLLMANVYYDFPDMVPAVSPYIGGGIGYGYVTAKLGAGDAHHFLYRLDVNDSVFAYQGTAGLTYNVVDNYAINIDYRFVATSRAGHLGKVFQANLAEVGVTYRFDGGAYQ